MNETPSLIVVAGFVGIVPMRWYIFPHYPIKWATDRQIVSIQGRSAERVDPMTMANKGLVLWTTTVNTIHRQKDDAD